MSAPNNDPVLVGVVLGPHGNDGRVRARPETDNPQRFRRGGRMTAQDRPLVVERTQRAPDGALLVKFEGVADRDAADALRGAELRVPAEDTPQAPPDAYYHYQLIGISVASAADGEPLGTLTEIVSTGANDVYVVTSEDAELLLPALAAVVTEVDVDAGRMAVAVPDGLEWRTLRPRKKAPRKRPPRRKGSARETA